MTTLIDSKPAPGSAAAWSFPTTTTAAANGVTLIAADLPGRAMVSLTAVSGGGTLAEPAGLEGVAQIASNALSKGARGLDEEALAIAFESVGASPTGGASTNMASYGLSAPGGLLADASELLADVVRRPTLDEGEIKRCVDLALAGLAASEANPNFVVGRVRASQFYSSSSRLSTLPDGTAASLGAIDADAVRSFHRSMWGSAPLTLVVVGDLSVVDLAAITKAFESDVDEVTPTTPDTSIAGGGRRIALADMPGSVQSVIALSAPGPAFDIPDGAALDVAQTVVLAAFSARMNLRLREALGYTYGVSGSFQRDRTHGLLTSSTQVRNEVTAASVQEMIAILEASIGDAPLTDAEVEQARDNLVAKFPVNYDGASAVAQAICNRVLHGLAADERDVMLAKLRTVSTEQANEAWRTHVDLDELTVTIAGDAAAVRQDLEGLGYPVIDA